MESIIKIFEQTIGIGVEIYIALLLALILWPVAVRMQKADKISKTNETRLERVMLNYILALLVTILALLIISIIEVGYEKLFTSGLPFSFIVLVWLMFWLVAVSLALLMMSLVNNNKSSPPAKGSG